MNAARRAPGPRRLADATEPADGRRRRPDRSALDPVERQVWEELEARTLARDPEVVARRLAELRQARGA